MLLATIHEVLRQQNCALQDVHALAVVTGPGSFTGLRIGVGVVQGLALALEVPVVLLSSLQWQAQTALSKHDREYVMVLNRARDAEYYWGFFQRRNETGSMPLGKEKVGPIKDIELPLEFADSEDNLAVGDGWEDLAGFEKPLGNRFAGIVTDLQMDTDILCDLARQELAGKGGVSAESVLPSYLKENMHYRTAT